MRFIKLFGITTTLLILFPFQQALSADVGLKNKKEAWRMKIEMDFQAAPIKTKAQLDSYLAVTPIENTPFKALAETEREIFIDTLVFTDKGLASFHADVLSYGPTATEVYNILALFGSQSATPSLHALTIESEADRSIMASDQALQDWILYEHLCTYIIQGFWACDRNTPYRCFVERCSRM
ncbi:hypothetical protein [Microbulbifer spongiae]|uniref:Uncharacterized protein n=1 Tax=Microbulbifer spongiae TaxID=2944933 RepID=A0ABY9E7P5_9GAMM|nr:hypothetical protein [Microbulbifer sp. MI-G]WKD48172.1 hypothetical protein M8T91_09440 [Microbulbifer sp. MI-G]